MEDIRILAVIQARIGSSRLPGKVLFPLGNKTVIEQVVRRVNKSTYINDLFVATSIDENNLPLIEVCCKNKIKVFAGSENNVLDRFYQLAKLINPDHVVRLTADCPLIDFQIIDQVIEKHLSDKNEYTTNTNPPTYPDGLDVEVFTFQALEYSWKNASKNSEFEHVTPYIRNSGKFKLGNLLDTTDRSNLRWTLDEEKDYQFLKQLFMTIGDDELPNYETLLGQLESNTELLDINANITRNEGYLKSLKKDKE